MERTLQCAGVALTQRLRSCICALILENTSASEYILMCVCVCVCVCVQDVLVADGGGLLDAAEPIDFMPGFSLQGIPNRDSRTYRDSYGIQSAHTCKRGTLRYTVRHCDISFF